MTRAEIALVTACWLAHRDAKRRAKAPKHAGETVLWPWSPGLNRREGAA